MLFSCLIEGRKPGAGIITVGAKMLLVTYRSCKGTNFMTATRQPILRKPNEGLIVAVVGDLYRFLARGKDTDGRYATWEAIVPPGGGPPPHVHSREEESFFVLEGEIALQIGEQWLVAKVGTFVNIPVGVWHSFRNETDKQARMIISIAPAGLEEMFIEAGQQVLPDGTIPTPSKEDFAKLMAAAPRYGVEIRLPTG
jgi:quercetin dioxygenase-like cupin family protein